MTNTSNRTPLTIGFVAPQLEHDEEGRTVLSLSLVNEGQRVTRPETYLDLYDNEGRHVLRSSGKARLLGPRPRWRPG